MQNLHRDLHDSVANSGITGRFSHVEIDFSRKQMQIIQRTFQLCHARTFPLFCDQKIRFHGLDPHWGQIQGTTYHEFPLNWRQSTFPILSKTPCNYRTQTLSKNVCNAKLEMIWLGQNQIKLVKCGHYFFARDCLQLTLPGVRGSSGQAVYSLKLTSWSLPHWRGINLSVAWFIHPLRTSVSCSHSLLYLLIHKHKCT